MKALAQAQEERHGLVRIVEQQQDSFHRNILLRMAVYSMVRGPLRGKARIHQIHGINRRRQTMTPTLAQGV